MRVTPVTSPGQLMLAVQALQASGDLRRPLGCRIDHLRHFCDLCCWEAADLRMFADNRLILRKVDAESLVGRYEAFYPLDIGTELIKDLVRLCCSLS